VPTLLFVRHAQGSFGTADYDVLSERGHEQAAALTADLDRRGVEVTRVVSGTLARQRDTAAPVAEHFGRAIEEDRGWNEYESDEILASHASPELATGTQREFQAQLDEALRAWIAGRQGDRSWPAFRERVEAAFDALAGCLRSGDTAVVCTSGGPIAAICMSLLELPADGFVALNRVLVNGGVTKVITGSAGATLLSYNEHAYLERRDGSLVTYR
jgi:broad specificity phosphatase PhoE